MNDLRARCPGRALLAALAVPLLLGSTARAQSAAAGSASHLALLPGASAGAGSAASESFGAELILSYAPAGDPLSSESFELEPGPVFFDGVLESGPPLVLGIAEGAGTKDGGLVAHVIGFGFADPSAGVTGVSFAGAAAGAPTVISNTQVQVTTPPGTGPLENPLAGVEVALANDLGSDSAAEGYTYLPALLDGGPASLSGGELRLAFADAPGSLAVLSYGLTIPGVGLPVPPLDGSLEILAAQQLVPGITAALDGTTSWSFPLPDAPQLIGKSLAFQAASLSSLAPLAGSFTNVHTVTFLP